MQSKKPSIEEVQDLVTSLEEASELPDRGKATKKVCSLFDSNRRVVSWKFQEWDYGKKNVPLPCNARGLFITDEENPQIVARGYDKFFNIGEVPFTKWEAIESSTVGPYTVTVKSNGCIIFISGLNDGTLVVCSKHSTGPRDDVDRNHAEYGREYLLNILHGKKIDVESFAKKINRLNVTLVAEYCDDSFEEHILEYSGEKAGLYLHGINSNLPKFDTWPMDKVNSFAQEYGFKTTNYFEVPNIHSLKSFLNKCSHEGTYNGMEIEGFVIRTHLLTNSQDFFFKFKFEEPYLMYRQWREITKQYITSKSRVLKFKKHKSITNRYLSFVIPLLEKDPELCEQYMKGFGIIKLRNMFLDSYGMSGLEILNQEKIQELELKNSTDCNVVDESTKFLIFPIAVIGCGKTTTALTLTNLFADWGHVQNDNITGKDKAMLMKKSLELLSKPEIRCVFVDRNNHQRRERQQLFDWLAQSRDDYLPYDTNIKVIGLSFASHDDLDRVKKLTIERVLARGDNHQSIKSSVYGEQKVLGIMNGFLKRFQPVDERKAPDNLFDYVIYLSSVEANSSFTNSKTIIQKIHEKYHTLIPEIPSNELIDEALQKSLHYKPTTIKVVGGGRCKDKNGSNKNGDRNQSKSKKPSPIYFSANVDERNDIIKVVRDVVSQTNQDKDNSLGKLFTENRDQANFHITMSHVTQGKKGTAEEKQAWQAYLSRYQAQLEHLEDDQLALIPTNDVIKFKPHKLCWDSKIVTMVVQFHGVSDSHGKAFPELTCCNKFPHITVGILQDGIKPFYSNELCERIFEHNHPTSDTHWVDLNEKEIEARICINLQ
ncbi:TRL1 (YJL087C) [Zygosaccharomyces parabailii]|nr:TRL1 (YJL087C) [Zygosaccharomyces parabailii]